MLAKAFAYSKMIFEPLDHRLTRAYQVQMLEKHKSKEVPAQIIAILHAMFAFLVGILSFMNAIGRTAVEEMTPLITAHFYYDLLKSIEKWESVSAASRQKAESRMRNPTGVAIHHIIGILYLNGFLILDADRAITVFCICELPVCLISFNRVIRLLGGENSRLLRIVKNLTVLTYGARVTYFFCSFLQFGIPNLSLFRVSTFLSLPLLGFVFILNIIWFIDIYDRDASPMLRKHLQKKFKAISILDRYLLQRRQKT